VARLDSESVQWHTLFTDDSSARDRSPGLSPGHGSAGAVSSRSSSAVRPAGWQAIGHHAAVKVFQRQRELRTAGGLSVRDITDEVQEAVRESGVTDGIACVYSPHTTCCVRVNEFESGFLEDFAELLKRLVPTGRYYAHDDWDKRTENLCEEDMHSENGHAHCMAMLLGTAGEAVPIRDGELQLGTWQRVLFLELDRERDRRWIVQVVGS
jgi:secondary thiamine-phosphate synthase enzyme